MRVEYILTTTEKQYIGERRSIPATKEQAIALFLDIADDITAAKLRKVSMCIVDYTEEMEAEIPAWWNECRGKLFASDLGAEDSLLCHDCGCSTDHDSKYYMVQDAIWAEAQTKGEARILCPDCLERRIGRRLAKQDYSNAICNERYFAARNN